MIRPVFGIKQKDNCQIYGWSLQNDTINSSRLIRLKSGKLNYRPLNFPVSQVENCVLGNELCS